MRPLRLLAAVAAALPLGAYTYDYQDAFTSIDNAKWTRNGTLSESPTGLISSDGSGGSLIYKLPSSTGNNYEVALTLRLSASGGNYRAYLRATPDANMGSPVTGSFYAVDVYPVLNGNTWDASVSVWRASRAR